MGLVKAAEKDTYLDTARTFEYDRMRAAIQSKRLAWTIASGACVLAVIATGAVAMLAPLKTVEPYVIRVDRSSGETEILTALKGPQPRTYEDAVNRYFVAEYVRLREGWLNDAARENAYAVMLMSDKVEGARLDSVKSNNDKALKHLWRQGLCLDPHSRDLVPEPHCRTSSLLENCHNGPKHARCAELDRHPHLQVHDSSDIGEGPDSQSARLSGREFPFGPGDLI
jgi:hypothetical protein